MPRNPTSQQQQPVRLRRCQRLLLRPFHLPLTIDFQDEKEQRRMAQKLHTATLVNEARAKEERLSKQRLLAHRAELDSCTFIPHISPFAHQLRQAYTVN